MLQKCDPFPFRETSVSDCTSFACNFLRPPLEVTNVSTVDIDVLNKEISNALRQKPSNMDTVCLAKSVTYNGLNYKCGMILIHGSLCPNGDTNPPLISATDTTSSHSLPLESDDSI